MTTRTSAVLLAAVTVAWALACENHKPIGTDLGPQPDVPADTIDVPADVVADTLPDLLPDVVPDVPADVPPEATDPGIDTGPKPFLSARKAATAADLATGDNAWGAAGKAYVVENSKARFVIQDKGAAVHLGVYGGDLIDADLARKPFEAGNDQFREMFALVGMRVSSVDKVEVFKDGSDGDEAIIRVTGVDAPSGILPDIDPMASPLEVTIITDYALRPDEPVLRVRTTVVNGANDPAMSGIMAGDFLTLGGASFVFTPEGGFTGTPTSISALIGTGRGQAYAYTPLSGTFDVPAIDSNGTLTILDSNLTVPAQGGRVMFERLLVVGTDIASVMGWVQTVRNLAVHKVSGHVTDSFDGAALSDAVVTAFPVGLGDPTKGGHAVNQAKTVPGDDAGAFAMTLAPGMYDLVFSAPGRARVVKTVDLTAGDQSQDAVLPRPGMFGLEAKEHDLEDKDLGFIPAKASLACLPDATMPWDELGERLNRGLCGVFFNPTGQAKEFPLMPGRYTMVVSRGPEYEVVTDEEVVIEEGKTTWRNTSLLRSVKTPGFQAGDFHQHTIGSIDAEVTHAEKVVENAVEGVEIAACTDHDMATSYNEVIQSLNLSNRVFGYDGDEVSVSLVGHFNVFTPEGKILNQDRTPGSLYDYAGGKLYANRSMDEVFAAMQSIPGVDLIQMNHPRDGHAYLNWVGYDPVAGRPVNPERSMFRGFGSIEVKDSIGTPADFLATNDGVIQQLAKNSPGKIPVMRDWFSMLNGGYAMAGVANSDAHNRNDGVGYGRNYLRVGTDKPQDLSAADVTAALVSQKVVGSNGIFVRVMIDGKDQMGFDEVVVPTGGSLVVDVTVQAPSWVDVDTLEVYASGRPLPVAEVAGKMLQDETALPGQKMSVAVPLSGGAPSTTIRVDTTLRLFPKVDTWYVIVAKGKGSLDPVGRGSPWAYTNPLYVDVGGDGYQQP